MDASDLTDNQPIDPAALTRGAVCGALACSRLHNPETEMETCKEIEITPEMIEAAATVLEQSGLLEYWAGPPAKRVVKRMLCAALQVPSETHENRD